MATTSQLAGDSHQPPDGVETVYVHMVTNMVQGLTAELSSMERSAPPALDGYIAELAEDLAGITVEWVRRGPRR